LDSLLISGIFVCVTASLPILSVKSVVQNCLFCQWNLLSRSFVFKLCLISSFCHITYNACYCFFTIFQMHSKNTTVKYHLFWVVLCAHTLLFSLMLKRSFVTTQYLLWTCCMNGSNEDAFCVSEGFVIKMFKGL